LKIGGVQREEMHFVSWKAYFSSGYVFIIPFPLQFKDEGPKRRNAFCKLESLFFFWLCFHYSFSFAVQR
jgi:hypothetical protein